MAAPRKDNVKELILDTAEKLLTASALADISLAEIARTAGISKGTLYYHYKNKDEILLDLTDRYLSRQWQDLIDWTGDATKDTSINRLVKCVLERDVSTAGLRLHFFYDAMLGNEQIRQRLLDWYTRFSSLIAEKVGERTDVIPSGYLTWLLLLLSDGLFIHKTIGNTGIDTAAFIQETSEYVRRLMASGSASPLL